MPDGGQKNESVNDTLFLVKKAARRTARNGKDYLDLVVSNMSLGELPAKLWNIGNFDEDPLADSPFIKAGGTIEKYNGVRQFRIEKIEHCVPSAAELPSLVESTPYPPEKMYERITEEIDSIESEDLRILTKTLYERHREELLYYPAAMSVHHNMLGGLLYHVYTMLRAAMQLCGIYTFLNRDLVRAGVVLHDIGKLKEMNATDFGTVTDYSEEGNLLGHIITGITEIDKCAAELGTDPKILLLLKHMILSHHGKAEYGSSKEPAFAEAELLHYVDVLDARLNQFEKILKQTPPLEFSPKIYSLEGRILYNHSLNNKEKDIDI